MIRTIAVAVALAAAAVPAVALADDAAPTEDQLAEAKKAFGEGKKLFDKGKYADAAEKFKESFRLSKNPLLLYNIALTYEKLDNVEKALFYYRKFLKDAPEGAAQRGDAEKSVQELAKREPLDEEPDDAPKPKPDPVVDDPPDPEEPDEPVEQPKPNPNKKKRVAASYTAEDFQHTIVEDAPPGKPLDLTAFAPEDAGWTVTLFYRGAGKDKFTAIEMVPRYNELVGRIPAAEMAGNAIQYYVEVKGADGALVERIGKSSSPNVVYIDASAQPRFYPDFDGSKAASGGGGGGEPSRGRFGGDDEDPLAGMGGGGGGGGGGLTDTGSSKFNYLKWGTTGVGGGMLLLSVTFYAMASSWSNSLEAEAAASHSDDCAGDPPCRPFDDHRKNIEATGQRYETLSKVTFGVGLAVGAVAGYLWYREMTGNKTTKKEPSVVVTPAAGDGYVGGAAAIRF